MYNLKKLAFDGEHKLDLDSQPCRIKTGKTKEEEQALMDAHLTEISKYQDKLFADKTEGLVILLQGMDAAGKDGLISHVMRGVNPQGVNVYSFKQPAAEELAHDYLWRIARCLPERGKIAIFNRSYYEDVLIVKVHDLYRHQGLPERCLDEIFEKRYEQIRCFEKYLWENGIRVVKLFLHLSKEEQRERLLDRIDDKTKNWKFSLSDVKEREFWDGYQTAYQDAINATASRHAPWYVVPADKKPAARLIASEIILNALKDINPDYPKLTDDMKHVITQCAEQLRQEQKNEKNTDKQP